MANIFAFAESRHGELRRTALEVVTAARELADSTGGGEVHAMLAGAPGIGTHADQLAAHGADVVLVLEHASLAQYAGAVIAATAAARIKGGTYRAALFSASAQGRDLAPRVAAAAGAPYTGDVVSISQPAGEDTLRVTHPVYTGKLIATIELQGAPVVLALRPKSFAPAENRREGRLESLSPAMDPDAARARVTELIEGGRGEIDLADAPVVVSGGRGLKAPENFALLEELAAAFGGNAAVGATRAVTDEGWRPHNDQIGQTGRLVSPDLYIAVGISGAIQHLAGMRTSRTIVAINKDKDAPIFGVADYGIVGDALEIVPVLTEAIRKARA